MAPFGIGNASGNWGSPTEKREMAKHNLIRHCLQRDANCCVPVVCVLIVQQKNKSCNWFSQAI